MSVNRRIASDSVRTTFATFFMQGAAFVVSIIVAQLFGANLRTDAYFLALAVPALFTAALFGALKAVFVPVHNDYLKKNPEEEKELLGSTYFTVLFVSSLVGGILYVLAPYFVPLMAIGMNEEGRILSVVLARELMPLVVLTSMAGLMGTIYNAYQRFVIPILTPLVRTLVLLVFIIYGRDRLGIHALSFGTVVGELLQLTILIFAFRLRGFYVGLKLAFHPAVKRMARLSIPPITGNLILEFNPLVDKIMIASTAVGSVTALNYAVKLNDIPLMLLSSGGFMAVILAHWSKLKADKDIKEVTRSLEQSLTMVTFILAPFLTAFFVLRHPIVSFIYERREFTSAAADNVATLWGILVFGVIPLLLGRILVRVYHVMQDTVTPFWIGISRTFLNVALNFWFKSLFGLAGIALSTSVTAVLLTVVNFYLLKRKVKDFRISPLVVIWSKIGLCAIVAGLVMMYTYQSSIAIMSLTSSKTAITTLAALGLSSFLGLVIYLIMTAILKLKEFALISLTVTKKISLKGTTP